MLCVAKYDALYGEKEVDGHKQRVVTQPNEEKLTVLKPHTSMIKARKGYVNCFNEEGFIKSYQDNNIQRENQYTLKSHIINHNRYDITLYQGKDRDFVEKNFGIAQSCAPLKGGAYCNHAFGLDIFYAKNNKVNTIFLYGNTLNRGNLAFEQASLFKLRNNEGPLGLWVTKHYKKLFSKKPTLKTQNVMIWEHPAPKIKRVIVTAAKGHYELGYTIKDGHNLFRSQRSESNTPMDYIQAIEVQYQ